MDAQQEMRRQTSIWDKLKLCVRVCVYVCTRLGVLRVRLCLYVFTQTCSSVGWMHNLSRFILWAIHWAYKKNSCVWADNVTLPWQHYNILHSLIFASNVSCKDKDSLQQHSFIYLLYLHFTEPLLFMTQWWEPSAPLFPKPFLITN